MSVSAPRELRQVVAYQVHLYQSAIAFLRRTPAHAPAADALEAEYVRLAKFQGTVGADGKSYPGCPCGFSAVCGPCRGYMPDPSGGFCRRCAHHKDCHRIRLAPAPAPVSATDPAPATSSDASPSPEPTTPVASETTEG